MFTTSTQVVLCCCRQIAVLYNGPTASRTEWYMTQLTNLSTHHYNPFVSPDGQQVGYHRCRCLGADSDEYIPVLERHTTSLPGAFPSTICRCHHCAACQLWSSCTCSCS